MALQDAKTTDVAVVADQLRGYRDCLFEPEDIIEIRRLPVARSTWHKASELPKIARRLLADNRASQNIYVGANPRKKRGDKDAAGVALMRSLFVDLDGITIDEALARLQASGLPRPTLIVFSGHGVHFYWRLDEPIVAPAHWTTYQKRLIKVTGADKGIHDAPRVMRLPGFINHKEPIATAELVDCDPLRRYTLAAIEECLPDEPEPEPDEPVEIDKDVTRRALADGSAFARAMAYVENVPGCKEHGDKKNPGRNSRAFYLAATLTRDFALPEDQALKCLRQWNRRNTPKLNDAELMSCLRNGDTYGKEPVGKKLQAKPFHLTDSGNAERLAARHGDVLRYCWDAGGWRHYDGVKWNTETGEQMAQALAAETARAILADAERKEGDARKKILKWSMQSESAARVRAMLQLARDKAPIAAYRDDFDRDPFAFNCQNATIKWRDGGMEVCPHDSADMITKVAAVTYDPLATCPLWLSCVDTWMAGDAEKTDYLKRLLGSCLTGDVSARVAPFWYGAGLNGKSVCGNAMLGLLGDYGTTAPRGLLASRFNEEHPTEIASLFGVRLAVASETRPNMRLRVDLVKQMTGERTLKARHMREDYFEFQITHKTIMMTNSLPVIEDTSDSIWDRVHLLPWTVRIPPEKVDGHLIDKLAAERSGILNWLIEGACKIQTDSWLLIPPEVVKVATREYRHDQDVIGRFADDCLDFTDPEARLPVRDMRAAFNTWCDENGERAKVTSRQFNDYFKGRGFVSKNTKIDGRQKYAWHVSEGSERLAVSMVKGFLHIDNY